MANERDAQAPTAAEDQNGGKGPGPSAGAAAPNTPEPFNARDDLPDAASYPLMSTLKGHTRAVTSVKFSVGGEYVASASADKTAKIWRVSNGELVHTLEGHEQGISDVAWSSDGRMLATASDDKTLRLWDAATGRSLRTLREHTHAVFCCCFNKSGNLLVSGSYDEAVIIWDVQHGCPIKRIPAHSDPVTAVDVSSEEPRPMIASASFDGLSRIWLADTGRCLTSLMDEDNPPVSFIKFSPNHRFVLTGTLGSKLLLWDFNQKKIKKTYEGHRNTRHCLQAAFLVNEPSEEKYIVCGSEDHHVFLWRLNNKSIVGLLRGRADPGAPGDGHCDVVLSVAANDSVPMIASAGGECDCTVKLWRHSSVQA